MKFPQISCECIKVYRTELKTIPSIGEFNIITFFHYALNLNVFGINNKLLT